MTMTNREWLRNLPDERLAKFLINVSRNRCIACNAHEDGTCDNKTCEQAITEWLEGDYHQLTWYDEECPHCGKETHGHCDERLLGVCEHCGKEIKICSVCPGACPYRDTAGEADECKDCLYEHIDCRSVDCSNCIAGKAVMIAEGVAELKHEEEKGDD